MAMTLEEMELMLIRADIMLAESEKQIEESRKWVEEQKIYLEKDRLENMHKIELLNDWKNYGDVQFMEFGGLFVKSSGDDECEAVQVSERDEKGLYTVNDMRIDTSDKDMVLDLLIEYGVENYGGNNWIEKSNAVIDMLIDRGIVSKKDKRRLKEVVKNIW